MNYFGMQKPDEIINSSIKHLQINNKIDNKCGKSLTSNTFFKTIKRNNKFKTKYQSQSRGMSFAN